MNKFEIKYNLEIQKFGERLKEIRELKRMTQLDLEVSSGINRTEISRIENGQKNIEFMTITKLAIALEIEIKELFIHTGKK